MKRKQDWQKPIDDWGKNPDTDTPQEAVKYGGALLGIIVLTGLKIGILAFIVWIVFKVVGVL